ncbi:hypothetical protein EMIT0158MI4_130191 [Burkholderia ambifaria]
MPVQVRSPAPIPQPLMLAAVTNRQNLLFVLVTMAFTDRKARIRHHIYYPNLSRYPIAAADWIRRSASLCYCCGRNRTADGNWLAAQLCA